MKRKLMLFGIKVERKSDQRILWLYFIQDFAVLWFDDKGRNSVIKCKICQRIFLIFERDCLEAFRLVTGAENLDLKSFY